MTASFGCPRCSGTKIYKIKSTDVWYEVIAWNDEGEPERFGAEFNDGSEAFNCYECRDCVMAQPDECMFEEPVRLPLEVDRG